MALIPYGPPGLGLYKDSITGIVGTPGGGFGGKGGLTSTSVPNEVVKTAPRPEVPKDDIPTTTVRARAEQPNIAPPDAPPDVTAPGQPYEQKPKSPVAEREPAPEKPEPQARQENPEQAGEELWMRRWKLSIGPQTGAKALDLSELAFEFDVEQAQFLIPYTAMIKIYNVGDDIISKMQKELTYIYLEAGYRGAQYGKLFAGEIAYYIHGRLNATDTFVEIHATNYSQPHTQAFINTLVPIGHTKADIVKAAIEVMAPYGITAGQMTDLGDEKSPRARVLHGQAGDVLRDVAHTADCQVFIDPDGKLHLLRQDEVLKTSNETVPILNSKTGLLDVPSLELGGGVQARTLLNPRILPGTQVKINERDITRIETVHETSIPTQQAFAFGVSKMSLKHDGYYAVLSAKHWGENRGNPWYSDIKTMKYDPQGIPIGIRSSV